jgi:hypothetical protein
LTPGESATAAELEPTGQRGARGARTPLQRALVLFNAALAALDEYESRNRREALEVLRVGLAAACARNPT